MRFLSVTFRYFGLFSRTNSMKFSNPIAGWQYRWFNVDPQAGTLSYYLCESSDELPPTIIGNSPRGQVILMSCRFSQL